MSNKKKRDEFPARVRTELAKRAGWQCSSCRCPTEGPTSEEGGSVSLGVAAHITAAAPGGPRFDPSLTPEQRSSVQNGIWLCGLHGREIDLDCARYSVGRLCTIKVEHELRVRRTLGVKPADRDGTVVASLDALAIHEIRKGEAELQMRDPEGHERILTKLAPFVDPLRYSPCVRLEYLEMLVGEAYWLRGSPFVRDSKRRNQVAKAADLVAEAARYALPSGVDLAPAEEGVLSLATEIGFQFAYDGSLHTEDLRVVDAGADILWWVLRAARLGDGTGAAKDALDKFGVAIEAANRAHWPHGRHAADWLAYRRDDALAGRRGPLVPIPEAAQAALEAARASPLLPPT